MAILFSIADGNLNATASWGVVEPTSFLGTPNITTTATPTLTSLYTGTSFILASAVTVAGVALLLSGRVAAPTGTLNVQLYDVTGGTIIGQVTINMVDLPNSNGVGANHIDWTYFKFASPVTTIAGRTYAVRFQMSVISQISWYYTTATSNFNKALVTTANQAPATSDQLIIAGSYTSAGVNSTTTITMSFYISSPPFSNIWISSKGIFKFPTSGGVNAYYFLAMAGYLIVGVGGVLNIGTALDPILGFVQVQMQCTTALQYPIWVYGTMTTYGISKTIATKLAADVVVGATSSTTSTSTGWSLNSTSTSLYPSEVFAVTSTTRTYTQYEFLSLSATASGTTLTHNAYTNAHGGDATSKVQADIVNLTRNIQILGNGIAFANKTNIQMFPNSVTSFYYTLFNSLGTGVTVANSGICVNLLNTGYTFDMQYCVMTDGTQAAANTANTALFDQNTIGTTISNNIFYGLGWSATTVSTISVYNFGSGNFVIGCLATTQVLLATNTGSNNTFSSNNTPATTGFLNNASNNSFYSNNTVGLNISQPLTTGNTNLTNFLIWRNNTYGIAFIISNAVYQRSNLISFNGLYCFGNTTASINITGRIYEKIYFYNSFFYGGTTLVQPTHITNSSTTTVDSFYYNNCYIGYSDTSLTVSQFSGFIFSGFYNNISTIFSNCYFTGTLTQAGFYSGNNLNGNMISLNHNGVTGSNRQYTDLGTISTDFVIYNSPPKSLRVTMLNVWSIKITSPLVKVPVKIGTTCTISVFVRKSITADGAVNNGTQARLMYAFNPVLGNLTETIGDTTKNIFTYPQNFENSIWNKTSMTITPDSVSVAAPDGTFTADLFVEDNTTNRHRLLYNGITLVSGTYNISIYAKKNVHDWIQLYPVGNNWSTDWANFNLNTGTIGNKGAGTTASITNAGDGWWRLSIQATLTISTGVNEFPVVCMSTNNTNSGIYPSYLGTLAQCFYIWGAQLTLGPTLLPYYDNGLWENLTYTTATFSNDGVAEFYVDSDGYIGWINIDDWNVNTSVDSRTNDYWDVNATYVEPDFKRGTTSYTFVK